MWLVLMSLKRQPMASQRELAAMVGIEGATLSHHLSAMEEEGLITRRRDPANRRVHIVELTVQGEAAFVAMLGTVQAFDRRLRDGFTDDEIAALARMLTRLGSNVADRSRPDPAAPGTPQRQGAPS
jgi:MarR family transcriptional regulator for hemolysin